MTQRGSLLFRTDRSMSETIRVGFNVCHLADPKVRGLTRYTLCLLRALTQMPSLELVLFCKEPPCREHLEQIRAEVVTFDAAREFLWNNHVLPRMIRLKRISIFHAPADRGLPLTRPCPLVVTVHGSYERTHWQQLFPSFKSKLWYWSQELANSRADAVLTVSDTTRDSLVKLGIAPLRKIRRVYLAPAPEFTHYPCTADASVLQQHSIASPYLLYVGGYNRWKNVETLVTAFDNTNLRDHQLVVVAEKKWEYKNLLQNWKSLACFPRLRLIEASNEDIPALYRQADFFVNPSLWESFSLQLVEAMGCGTPILASNRTAIPEICNGAALLFDPEDTAELAKLMERVAHNSELKKQLQDRGFRRVASFSWKNTALQTLAIYRQLHARRSMHLHRNYESSTSQNFGTRAVGFPD